MSFDAKPATVQSFLSKCFKYSILITIDGYFSDFERYFVVFFILQYVKKNVNLFDFSFWRLKCHEQKLL